ncbi:MAG: hypothetical protein VXX63_05870 [Bacteroidota bacterium]|nr:hypothetical protein [Bacteroidota bacterium]
MKIVRRIIEIMWLTITAVSLVELFIALKDYGFGHQKSLIFSFLSVVSISMYFLRKKQRRQWEKNKNETKN